MGEYCNWGVRLLTCSAATVVPVLMSLCVVLCCEHVLILCAVHYFLVAQRCSEESGTGETAITFRLGEVGKIKQL